MSAHDFPNVNDLVAANAEYATSFDRADLAAAPSRRVAIVACMDARIDIPSMLGLENGQAHIIRNAGGVVTDDVIRSLALSQRALGTEEIVLVHHTKCGVAGLDEAGLKQELEDELGVKPSWSFEAFGDPHRDVVQSAKRLRMSPFVPNTDHISGFVYDVETGLLGAVDLAR